jgi:threonylcarbamoyladenosine tRNA methylthiotransferase MtaB
MALHFHVPLQSGCDRILRLMNRRYWTSQYAERIAAIRENMPNAAIGGDVMTGFPGETDDDHAISRDFVESLPFTYLHVFPYSARPGTPAAARPLQVNGRVIHERSRELLAIGARKRREFMDVQVGRTLSVLTLDETRDGARVALSSNYLKVLLPLADHTPNQLLDAKMERAQDDFLFGRVEGC